MSILNDPEQIRSFDPENMYNSIFDFPEHLNEGLKIGKNWNINTDEFIDIKNIVVAGMGGSAIGGDLIRTFLSSKLLIPYFVCRHYELPEFVDDETLVIVSSYSGNTEETLAALDDALRRKTMLAAITTGGLLADVAKVNEIPTANLPTGLQQRAALGYSFVPLLVFLEKIKLIKNVVKSIEDVIKDLQKYREKFIEDVPLEKNQAKTIANNIYGKIPIIYAGPTLMDIVALRWKGQLCENSKNLAFANIYPEFNHNELVGWSKVIDEYKDFLIVLNLRDKDDHPQISKRMDIVKRHIEEQGVEVIDINSEGTTPLCRMLSLIQLGDFVSYYLAILNKVDPTPVKAIANLKKALTE